jgi:hypothetical protein
MGTRGGGARPGLPAVALAPALASWLVEVRARGMAGVLGMAPSGVGQAAGELPGPPCLSMAATSLAAWMMQRSTPLPLQENGSG